MFNHTKYHPTFNTHYSTTLLYQFQILTDSQLLFTPKSFLSETLS